MKVKIKSKNYFLKHPKYDSSNNCIPIGSYFVSGMSEYCDKIINFRKTFFKSKSMDIYREEDTNEITGFDWNSWMFDILPIADEKKNYLLEF